MGNLPGDEINIDAKHHRHQAQYRSCGRQQDRSQTLYPGPQNSLDGITDALPQPSIGIDEHDIVVHDDPGQRNHPDPVHDDAKR